MPLLGSAAMLLAFDVDAAAIVEHDRWHTQEHLPERLSITGFLRGTRWVSGTGEPRYMVLYEVESLDTLASAPYLARLNAPTPWTSRIMPYYRGMCRGLCEVLGSFGDGLGGSAALIRFALEDHRRVDVQAWLLEHALPAIPSQAGMGSAVLLRGAQAAAMTNEQRIRGVDRGIDVAIIVTGYDEDAVAACSAALCAENSLGGRGAREATRATYRLAYALSRADLAR